MKNGIAAALLISTAWVSSAGSAGAADPLKLRVADSFPPGHYIAEELTKYWMAKVTEKTNKGVEFEYYPSEQLGKAKDLLSLAVSGVADISYVAPAFVTDKMPLSVVAELPLDFTKSCQGTAAFYRIAHGDGILAQREFAPNGVRVLFTLVLPPYQIFLAKPNLHDVASLGGLKIRTTGAAKELALRKLGAVPVQIPSPDVYQALSRGTIDGMLFPYGSIFPYDVQGLVKSASVGENFGSFVVTYVISEKKWKSLPADIQGAMTSVAEETMKRGCQITDEKDVADVGKLKALGVKIVEFDASERKKIRTEMSSVSQAWAAELDKRGKPGTTTLKAFESALR